MSHQIKTDNLILDPKFVGVLHSRLGEDIVINHPLGYRFETLVKKNLVDAVIVDTEDGFAQLGGMRRFLSAELGLVERNLAKWVMDGMPENLEKNIASLADWCRARSPEVTLVAIPSERPRGQLKGLILAPYDGSASYLQYSPSEYYLTHRDFIYNVTYEAISHAYNLWGARRIGITHFSRSKYGFGSCMLDDINGRNLSESKIEAIRNHCEVHKGLITGVTFRQDITTCQVEAMAHFCSEHKGIESFTFIDEHDGNHPLEIVNEFNTMRNIGVHRPIFTKSLKFWGIDFVDLDWTKAPEAVISECVDGCDNCECH